ncbi:helix-turn-helix transcriptional regulator [Streptomyces katsurahamanus]|uniref:Helix-turn-helix domain-containing protein n=1 Tax=Streptomyces katsurahamanus TaxID=2577098 RepID=A0ABW9NWI3_9ACTN|nr:helix-turn-helix domain-containing protein [Streptomyces katsurahamanus]MQS37647.1 helix-turn-helix domain-containing protein [Streptomyces katsurahamanus]
MPQASSQHETAFLSLPRAATYLGLSPNTLYVWRHRRQGPPSFRMGRRVMYRITVLDEWVRAQELSDSRSNTSLDPILQKPRARTRRVA